MAATKSHDDPHGALLRQLSSNLVQRCRVRQGTRLLVAASGGADSVALLRLLAMAAPARQWQLEVAHFDHGLRPDSKDDATFVRNLAKELDLPFHTSRWSAPKRSEEAARQARLAFLEETAQRQRCGVIVLGHHLDDQIETVLMRLARGSGPRGLLGMAWRRHAPIDFVRPLLDCPRSRLIAFLESIGQTWREDPTNQATLYLRNRVRQRVLPALEEALGPGWREHWSASIEDQRSHWNWIEAESRRLLERAHRRRHRIRSEGRLETCQLEPLRQAPDSLLRSALQIWLESAGARDLRRSHILDACHLVRNGQTARTLEIPGGIRMHREAQRISIESQPMQTQATGAGAQLDVLPSKPPAADDRLPAAGPKTAKSFTYRLDTHPVEPPAAARIVEAEKEMRTTASAEPPDPPIQLPEASEALVCADHLGKELTVRTPRPGEHLRLLGAPGQRRVARILQDHKIPKRLRPAWPVVADEEGIVWIPGAGVAERCRLGPSSRAALRLRLAPKEPR
jgi:tRNA(Ile)-lysidine synthase